MRILFRLQRSSSITLRCRLTVERGNERRYEKGAIQSAAAQRRANDVRQDGALPVLGAQRMSVSGLVEALDQAGLHLLDGAQAKHGVVDRLGEGARRLVQNTARFRLG